MQYSLFLLALATAASAQSVITVPFIAALYDGDVSASVVAANPTSTSMIITCASTPTPEATATDSSDDSDFGGGCLYPTVYVTAGPSVFQIQGVDVLSQSVSVSCSLQASDAAMCVATRPVDPMDTETATVTGSEVVETEMITGTDLYFGSVTVTAGQELLGSGAAMTTGGAQSTGAQPTGSQASTHTTVSATGSASPQQSTGAAAHLAAGIVGIAGVLVAAVAL